MRLIKQDVIISLNLFLPLRFLPFEILPSSLRILLDLWECVEEASLPAIHLQDPLEDLDAQH